VDLPRRLCRFSVNQIHLTFSGNSNKYFLKVFALFLRALARHSW